ncbi:MAG: Cof-type HAD-IIB family hydrolase [Lachnospiraceae bacterium]
MNFEMIVLDLDGTLTNSNKIVTERTKDALIQAQYIGKKVVLASGRPTGGILKLADLLKLDEFGGFVLSFNGARILNYATGEVISNQVLPAEMTADMMEDAKALEVGLLTYNDSEIIVGYGDNEFIAKEAFINQIPLRKAEDFVKVIDFPVNKFLMAAEPAKILTAMKYMSEKYKNTLNVFRSEPFFLELMPKDIDKASSLKLLAGKLEIPMERVICCGDGYNDISMIKAAGLGVAMANAQQEVKAAADYITGSNDEDGIRDVILKFLF